MIYVDASVIVAALTPEVKTQLVLNWLEQMHAGALCFSGWVATEVSSAFARKVRMGQLGEEERTAALHTFQTMVSGSMVGVPVCEDAFALAARLIDDPRSTLRAGDALHLAVASLGGHRLATLDTRLADAAVRAGVPVEALA